MRATYSKHARTKRDEESPTRCHRITSAAPGNCDPRPASDHRSTSRSIHFLAAWRATAWASASDGTRLWNGTTTPGSLRGSSPGFQTSIIADDPRPTVLPTMRIFQPRYSCSDLAAIVVHAGALLTGWAGVYQRRRVRARASGDAMSHQRSAEA